MNRVIAELNELQPDVVVVSGDLTTEGFRPEYKAWLAYADRIEAPLLTVPGNHDSRNVGYLHFEDLNEGQVGRVHYDWITDQFAGPAALKVFVLHHHLMPIPGTGRERSIVMDAGDLLEVLVHAGVHVVLSGHKHVPYVWRLEDLYIANAGTVSSLRLRGYGKPCYNVLDFDGDEVSIHRVFPFEGERHLMARFVLFETARHHREAPVQQVAGQPGS